MIISAYLFSIIVYILTGMASIVIIYEAVSSAAWGDRRQAAKNTIAGSVVLLVSSLVHVTTSSAYSKIFSNIDYLAASALTLLQYMSLSLIAGASLASLIISLYKIRERRQQLTYTTVTATPPLGVAKLKDFDSLTFDKQYEQLQRDFSTECSTLGMHKLKLAAYTKGLSRYAIIFKEDHTFEIYDASQGMPIHDIFKKICIIDELALSVKITNRTKALMYAYLSTQ